MTTLYNSVYKHETSSGEVAMLCHACRAFQPSNTGRVSTMATRATITLINLSLAIQRSGLSCRLVDRGSGRYGARILWLLFARSDAMVHVNCL